MGIKDLIKYRDKHKFQNIFITLVGAFLYSAGISIFIIPAGLYTGGFTGIAQLISDFTEHFIGYKLPVSALWLLLNIPVFVIGFKHVGRRFTFLSIVSVLFGSIILEFLPVVPLGDGAIDRMLYAIMGGVITGIGVGITLKVGSSTGGMDIVSLYLSYKGDRSVGQYSFVLNALIVLIAGATNVWDIALYTIINLFISTLVIDKIHTRHNKFTLLIVTQRREDLVKIIHSRVTRGITIIPATGAYLKQERDILFMVISSYELYNIKAIIEEVDPQAFTNVIKSQYIFGNFLKQKI
jgi:uncharacterized membrane-anchored protein YitT (DUF2179 family)